MEPGRSILHAAQNGPENADRVQNIALSAITEAHEPKKNCLRASAPPCVFHCTDLHSLDKTRNKADSITVLVQ